MKHTQEYLYNSLRRYYDDKLISILRNLSVLISFLKRQASIQTEYARENDAKITNIKKIYVCCKILSNDNKSCGSAQVEHFSSKTKQLPASQGNCWALYLDLTESS